MPFMAPSGVGIYLCHFFRQKQCLPEMPVEAKDHRECVCRMGKVVIHISHDHVANYGGQDGDCFG